MQGDGDGFIELPTGGRRWGRFGSAGLFLLSPANTVLLQLRAVWTHQGGTWGIPGGARNSSETPEQAALRETAEETGIDPADVQCVDALVTADASVWTYTTVIARCAEELPTIPNEESTALAWVPLDHLTDLPLLPAFADSLPAIRRCIRRNV